MYTIESLFQCSNDEITYEVITDYFNSPLEESNYIEYKSHTLKGDQKFVDIETKVLKTVCAFLNSEGGIIIWGAPEDKKGKDGMRRLDVVLKPIDRIIQKDRFVSKILNNIIPSPVGIKFTKLHADENRCVVILEVPESRNKPHQYKNVYSIRVDGQTISAPHYFIRALFNEKKFPKLNASLEIRDKNIVVSDDQFQFDINLFISNQSFYTNEEKLTISIVTNNTYQKNSRSTYEVLHYGQDIIEIRTIVVPMSILVTNKLSIQILVGGLKSPLVCSRYMYEVLKEQRYENEVSQRLVTVIRLNELSREVNKLYVDLNDNTFGKYYSRK